MQRKTIITLACLLFFPISARALDTIEAYIRAYPNQEQARMMNEWLVDNQAGQLSFTGLVDPTDKTVVTPQATVDYGYAWFSLSNGPAVLHTPQYDRFFSVSVFDMLHNVPAVIVNPSKPIVLMRPGQKAPAGDFDHVILETDQGLVLTRMVVVNNLDEVIALGQKMRLDGGDGDMHRDVQRFSPAIEKSGLALIEASIPHLDAGRAFGKKSGDVGEITSASAVMLGQLGTPSDTVRYLPIMVDEEGEPLSGTKTYELRVPAGIVQDAGYFSVTAYGAEDRFLIPNDKKVYDQTTYSAEPNADGTYTVTLSPDGSGKNGIPTGKPFYAILRAYVPVPDADMTVSVTTR